MLGNFLLYQRKIDRAVICFRECLANDLQDKLGARHKQLLAVLEGNKGLRDKRLRRLLKGTFGEDQMIDEIFALWNYSRALVAYAKKGRCDDAERLFKYAVDKNPIVPSLLLCWEGIKSGSGTHTLISIGCRTEAHDYAIDNRQYWFECEGALGKYKIASQFLGSGRG